MDRNAGLCQKQTPDSALDQWCLRGILYICSWKLRICLFIIVRRNNDDDDDDDANNLNKIQL